jgi:uroporphyrinogen-III synthase
MDDSQTLRGLRVLVTRPQTQAETLCRLLAARGADVRQLPLQAIESVRQSTIARQLQAGREADGWIFTSVNAVRFAAQLDAGVWPQCIAVGAATAAALSALGQSSLMPTSAYTSEGILELPELQDIGGKRYLIVTGEGGRNLLAPALQARGAEYRMRFVQRLRHRFRRMRY